MYIHKRKNHNLSSENAALHSNVKTNNQKSIVLIFINLLIIFLIMFFAVIAWMVNQRNINATNLELQFSDGPISLATLGDDEKYSEELHDMLNIPLGKEKEIDGKTYYITTNGTVSMQVNDDSHMNNTESSTGIMPGSYGKLEFYLIANQEGIKEVEVNILEAAYVIRGGKLEGLNPEDVLKQAGDEPEITAADIYDILSGHILLFDNYDSHDGYSGLIDDWKIRISASNYGDIEEFEVNKPYPVTLYWIWPAVFENYVIASVNQDGHVSAGYLFGYIEKSVDGDVVMNSDYEKIVSDMEQNSHKYFANTDMSKIGEYEFSDLTAGQFNYFSAWYNDADVLIGKYINYLYLNFLGEVVNE